MAGIARALGFRLAVGAWAVSMAACSGGTGPKARLSPRERCQQTAQLQIAGLTQRVVGTGSPETCTEEALRHAVEQGGSIRFDCGSDGATFVLSSELVVDKSTLIDGDNMVVLTSNFKSRLLRLAASGDTLPTLWLRNLTLTDSAADGSSDPKDPDAKGGAIRKDAGHLIVEHCFMYGNRAAWYAPEAAGGALYLTGPGDTVITDSAILANAAANGGAIAVRDSSLRVDSSSIVSNIVFGVGGVPGDGGTGGAIDMRGRGDLLLCETTFWDNYANSFGGALFRQTTGDDAVAIYSSSFLGNYVLPGHSVARSGGGAYIDGASVEIEATTFYGNGAASGGGLRVGGGGALSLLNDTFSWNVVEAGGGAGLLIDDSGPRAPHGTIINSTFADNSVSSKTGSGAAIAGGRRVSLRNSLFVSNHVTTRWGGIHCAQPLIDDGSNMQSGGTWEDGSDDRRRAPCTDGVRLFDAEIGRLGYYGGPTQTQFVTADSPAVGQGIDCPALDQRGQKRPSQGCTLGAYEPQ